APPLGPESPPPLVAPTVPPVLPAPDPCPPPAPLPVVLVAPVEPLVAPPSVLAPPPEPTAPPVTKLSPLELSLEAPLSPSSLHPAPAPSTRTRGNTWAEPRLLLPKMPFPNTSMKPKPPIQI